MVSVRRLIVAAVLGALLFPTISAAAQPGEGGKPTLSVLASSNTIKVTGSEGEDTATGYLSLLNSGTEPIEIEVRFQAASSDKVTVQSVTPTEVEPGGARRIGVTFAGLGELDSAATGQLIVAGGPSPVAQSVEVVPAPQPSAPWPEILLIGSFVAALMLALMVVGNMPRDDTKPLLLPAPGAKWDPKSWLTTLTAAGGVFGTVLGGVTFPTYPEQVTKVTLVNLNLFFGILVVVGPFLFQTLRKKELTPTEKTAGLYGTNLTLLISSTVTLWAVFGQLGAFSLLSWELIGSDALGIVAIAALVVLGLLAARYFFLTLSEAVVTDWSEPPAEEGLALAEVPPPAPLQRVRFWPLL